MTEIFNDVLSVLELYDYKFFINDTDLLEEFKHDLEILNFKFKNKIKDLHTSMITEHEPMIRNLIIKLLRLKDKYMFYDNDDSEDLSISAKVLNKDYITGKYFEISNYIEKLGIISANAEKSFVDILSKDLFSNLQESIKNILNTFKKKYTSESLFKSEILITYKSAVIENLSGLEVEITEITKLFDLLKDKFDYYCNFMDKIKDFDTKIMDNLYKKNNLYLYGLNKDYSTITSRSIIIQWIYCIVIIELYTILNNEISHKLIEIDNYLNYLNQF